jgi:release factor glutamine methyltransferase
MRQSPENRAARPETGQSYEWLLVQAEKRLLSAGVPDAGLDAWYLLSDTFGIGRADYLWRRKESPPAIPDCWEERLKKRCERMPLAYVLGKTEFMGLPFLVEPGVLIPRQDTETLVEWVLREERAGLSVVDMCAGSGCIGLSLEKLGGFDVTLCDLSPQARAAALRNREALALRAAVCGGDLFAGLPQGMRCDVIVSNPPYIASEVIASLQPEVRDYEPVMALEGGKDGLHFYRRLAREAPEYLRPGGRLYLEIGYDQGQSVPALFDAAGFTRIEVRRDLAGKDRVVRGVYQDV